MKNFIFLAIAFFTIQTISAQDVAKTQNENVFNTSTVDIKPEFPGGYDEFYKFLSFH